MDRHPAGDHRHAGRYTASTAQRGDEHTGVWVGEKKIASIGVAVKQWITFHGAAINLNTELDEFKQINPCGLEGRSDDLGADDDSAKRST